MNWKLSPFFSGSRLGLSEPVLGWASNDKDSQEMARTMTSQTYWECLLINGDVYSQLEGSLREI